MQKIVKINTHTVLVGLFILFSLTACKKVNEFLSPAPSKSTRVVATTTAHLNALLDNFYSLGQGPNFVLESNIAAVYSTDDYNISKSLYDARPAIFNSTAFTGIQHMLWDKDFLPNNASTDGFWNGEYQKIFYANMVLDYLDEVTGTEEEKAILKADAHFIRAYSHWVLVNTYALPFTEANRNEPGIPVKLSISFEEPFARAPIHKVYEQIESDLTEALKTPITLLQSGRARSWRASKAGVNGFAARYWLNRMDYGKANQYADAALSEVNTLVDYNTEMRYSAVVSPPITLDPGTPQQRQFTIQYPYTFDNQDVTNDVLNWKEFLYLRMLNHGSWWYIPSQDLLNLYDQTNDLRYKYHIVEGYSYGQGGMTSPSYDYPGYIFFFRDKIPSGPTVAEMYLIKAEALAYTNNIPGAMNALNTLRAKRMTPGAWVNLSAATLDDAVKKVTDERRREMPFAQRWFDLRRYNNNQNPNDDVVLSRVFYPYNSSAIQNTQPVQTYTLDKNSKRWAVPIPRTEIVASNGQIVQNNY